MRFLAYSWEQKLAVHGHLYILGQSLRGIKNAASCRFTLMAPNILKTLLVRMPRNRNLDTPDNNFSGRLVISFSVPYELSSMHLIFAFEQQETQPLT